MNQPAIKKLEKQDIEFCRAFASIINQGKFEIKGDAVQKCGALFNWFSNLDKRIEETLKAPLPETVRKELDVIETPKPVEETKQSKKRKHV
jgi:hypothetical protein